MVKFSRFPAHKAPHARHAIHVGLLVSIGRGFRLGLYAGLDNAPIVPARGGALGLDGRAFHPSPSFSAR